MTLFQEYEEFKKKSKELNARLSQYREQYKEFLSGGGDRNCQDAKEVAKLISQCEERSKEMQSIIDSMQEVVDQKFAWQNN